jgi:hypothetical protein
MLASTLAVILAFIFLESALMLYWAYQFFGQREPRTDFTSSHFFPSYVRPTGVALDPRALPVMEGPAAQSYNQVLRGSDVEPSSEADSSEENGEDVTFVPIFPAARVPIKALSNGTSWAEAAATFTRPSMDFSSLLFIHLPKCGGSSLSVLLRQYMCDRDPVANRPCCDPGACHKTRRTCPAISGCIGHEPNR